MGMGRFSSCKGGQIFSEHYESKFPPSLPKSQRVPGAGNQTTRGDNDDGMELLEEGEIFSCPKENRKGTLSFCLCLRLFRTGKRRRGNNRATQMSKSYRLWLGWPSVSIHSWLTRPAPTPGQRFGPIEWCRLCK